MSPLKAFIRWSGKSLWRISVFILILGLPIVLITTAWPPFARKWDAFVDEANSEGDPTC